MTSSFAPDADIDVKFKEANRLLVKLRSQIAEKLEPSQPRYMSETLHNRESSLEREASLNTLMIEINVLSRKIEELNPLVAQLYSSKKQFWQAYVSLCYCCVAQQQCANDENVSDVVRC